MKKKTKEIDVKIDKKMPWKGSSTASHVRNQDRKLKTADHFIVGVSPMARSKLLSAVKSLV